MVTSSRFAGGTGNPYFTTDTTAVLRAVEMGCDAVLKATNVDGVVCSADPKRDPQAKRSECPDSTTTQSRARLRVMDATAFALRPWKTMMPIIVFSIQDVGAVTAVLRERAVRPGLGSALAGMSRQASTVLTSG